MTKKARQPADKSPRGRPGRAGISREHYEELLVAYRERPVVGHVAKRCGVSRDTARKYIERGDPERGFPPIKARAAAITEKSQQMADDRRVTDDVEMVVLVREAKTLAREELRRRVDDPDRWGKEQMGGLLNALHKIETDLGVGGSSEPDPLADLDDVEAMGFYRLALGALERYGYGARAEEAPVVVIDDGWVPPGGAVEDEARVMQ